MADEFSCSVNLPELKLEVVFACAYFAGTHRDFDVCHLVRIAARAAPTQEKLLVLSVVLAS